MIKGKISSAAYVCGNTIEQETLSSVLAHYLPNTLWIKPETTL
jgi:hypothetical protein